VTPSYNCDRYIEETILSIKKQDYPNIEHIVVDGGSQDKTLEILKMYSDQITWTSEPDNGMYDAINKGFAKACGGIFTYINADDIYYAKDVIRSVVNAFVKNPSVDFTYGHCAFMDERGKILYIYKAPPFYRKLALAFPRNIFHQPTCFWRKRVHIGFDSSFKYCGDSNFFRYLCRNHVGKNIHQIIAKFRIRTDNIASLNREQMIKEDARVFGVGAERKTSLHFKILDLIYIRTILNLRANIKRFLLYYQGRPYL
jgi:glycosyltransferase involved in cell wall biosynthesis